MSLLRSVGYVVIGFKAAEEFLAEKGKLQQPRCLVLDVRLPGISGLQLQKRLASTGDRIPIVFISANGDIPMCAQVMKEGAIDFLTKPFREQDLLDIVQIALDREIARIDRDRDVSKAVSCYNQLTHREREIMKMVVTGQINRKIADCLGISEVTVKVHRGNVMDKMRASSLAELVRISDMINPILTSELQPKEPANIRPS